MTRINRHACKKKGSVSRGSGKGERPHFAHCPSSPAVNESSGPASSAACLAYFLSPVAARPCLLACWMCVMSVTNNCTTGATDDHQVAGSPACGRQSPPTNPPTVEGLAGHPCDKAKPESRLATARWLTTCYTRLRHAHPRTTHFKSSSIHMLHATTLDGGPRAVGPHRPSRLETSFPQTPSCHTASPWSNVDNRAFGLLCSLGGWVGGWVIAKPPNSPLHQSTG